MSATDTDLEVANLIRRYQLHPHPEGGYYREVYRSALQVESELAGARRCAMTHIYFLLCSGQFSRFHRVVHDELWHLYAGAPLHLFLFTGTEVEVVTLSLETEPMAVVPAGVYQAAQSSGDYTLSGCSVAPGFDFADFSFLADDPQRRVQLEQCAPHYCTLL